MPSELMNPAVVMAIRSLELRAKLVVNGFRTGLNRSPRHGFSVEFSEYRQYAQGDDPRFLDWKLFARRIAVISGYLRTRQICGVMWCWT